MQTGMVKLHYSAYPVANTLLLFHANQHEDSSIGKFTQHEDTELGYTQYEDTELGNIQQEQTTEGKVEL